VATIDEAPSVTSYLAMRLIARLTSRSERKARTRPRTWVQATVKLVLQLAGFSCLTISAWSLNNAAGIAVAGVSCFVLAWLSNGSSTVDDNPQSTMHSRRG